MAGEALTITAPAAVEGAAVGEALTTIAPVAVPSLTCALVVCTPGCRYALEGADAPTVLEPTLGSRYADVTVDGGGLADTEGFKYLEDGAVDVICAPGVPGFGLGSE